MCFDSETESFERYAEAMPDNCVFLVDTYDTLEGVRKAAEVGLALRRRGHELVGVRLDSGDLSHLSIEARRILDDAGLTDAVIVASNDLDEHIIESLKHQGAKIGVWGVGTKLATAYDQPALGGVYKLSVIREPGGEWRHKVKLSEQAVKISNPGIQQVRRFFAGGEAVADAVFDELTGIGEDCTLVDPMDLTRRKRIPRGTQYRDLLVPVFRAGELEYEPPQLDAVRRRTLEELAALQGGVRRFVNPQQYPVGLEQGLLDTKLRLVAEARGTEF
jgi:nicotinate phosphoribosyltransferase